MGFAVLFYSDYMKSIKRNTVPQMLNFFLVLVDVLSYKLAEFISYSIMVASYIKKVNN